MFLLDRLITALCCRLFCIFLCNLFLLRYLLFLVLRGVFREANKTVVVFKFCLMKHYNNLTKEIYNPEDPRTFKSVCMCEVSHNSLIE
jgi:hypothetical protein